MNLTLKTHIESLKVSQSKEVNKQNKNLKAIEQILILEISATFLLCFPGPLSGRLSEFERCHLEAELAGRYAALALGLVSSAGP